MHTKKYFITLISLLLTLFVTISCKKEVYVYGQTPSAKTFSLAEAQTFLTNYDYDYKEQAKQDIKSSNVQEIKNLKNYKTQYNVRRSDLSSAIEAVKTITEPELEKYESTNQGQEFTVVSWGPQETVPAAMKNPEFYVSFSIPVRALTTLENEDNPAAVFTVTPSLEGKFRWIGTRQVVFLPSEKLMPSQVYTIEVNENLQSLSGVKISGERIFKTKAQELRISRILAGTSLNQNFYYNSSAGVPLKNAADSIVIVNGEVTQEVFAKNIEVFVNSEKRSFSAIPVERSYDETSSRFKYVQTTDSNNFYVHIDGEIGKNSIVEIYSAKGTQDESMQSYYTLRPFELQRTTYQNYNKTLVLNFNQPVDKTSVAKSISFYPPLDFDENNISVTGNTVSFRQMKFEYETEYRIDINGTNGIKDIYGQELINSYSKLFTLPKAESYLKMLDIGNKILEAQFPHKFIIEHQNLLDGSYAISSTDDPITNSYNRENELHSNNIHNLKTALDNKPYFEEIDLDPYLKNGLGFISISTKGIIHYWNQWNKEYIDYDSTDRVNIQVTNLAITTRIGYDKVVAMVRTLSDNLPVPNAKIYLYKNSSQIIDDGFDYKKYFASGTTDKNGFVEIEIPTYEIENVCNAQYENALALFVENGNDKVTFIPETHYPWRFGISTTDFKNIYSRNKNLVFLFTDRGIYRPGETVSFRGIVRKQTRNDFEPESGRYEVKFEKISWSEDEVYETLEGSLSESGGFFGTFDIPNDIKPGIYYISFYQNGKRISQEPLQVSYFERLKFQASASIPDVQYYLGDTITTELKASYLAGGDLTGASYDASWYMQAVDFVPPSVEAQNYIFGPQDSYQSAQFVSQTKGKVNENGSTKISCNTTQGILGQAYSYRAEIGVTDISNQRIFAGAIKVVHPGMFYIGLEKGYRSGFPRTKEKLDIPFALFKIDGSIAPSSLVNDKLEYSITRTTWRYSAEDAVDGIYSRWEKVTEPVANGKLEPSSKGTISFTPEKAGYYTVSVLAKDTKYNAIKTEKSFYVTGADYYWYDTDNASALRLTPDRTSYKPGDTAKLLLESSLPKGDYLVTVERESIISSKVIHLDTSCTELSIPIEKEFLPLVYVSISSYSTRDGQPVHKYGEPDLEKPKGYYGVTALKVDLEQARFKVDVKAEKATYHPGEEITLELTATKDGNPISNAELTVMVVDRAVIDLINYHVQDPLNFFYSEYNFPLGVIGGDTRSMLMDPVTYKVKSLAGGDAESLNSNSQKEERKDFRPTALFEPVIVTDTNGKAKVSFKLPDSLTTYRVTAFGVAKNDFALNESEVLVQNPINVQAVQPRRLRVRDTAEAGVIITNLDSVSQKVTVALSVRAPQSNYDSDSIRGLVTESGSAFVDDKISKSITVPAGKTVPLYFNVAATNAGIVELLYEVKSKVINEKLVSKIEIEKPYTFETVAVTGTVQSDDPLKDEKVSVSENIIIPSWCDSEVSNIQITLDPSQVGVLGSAVKYVFDYPYGCLEQQSSKMLPLIIFSEYIETFGLKSVVENPQKLITTWFNSVKDEQHENGAFPYWPGSRYDSLFVSLRFLHIYKLASERGYSENEIGYNAEKLREYIKNAVLKNEMTNTFGAYANYVFSLYNDQSIKYILDQIYEKFQAKNELSLGTLSYAALAYENYSDADSKNKAKEISKAIKSGMKFTGRSVSLDTYHSSYNYYYGMYDNDSEALANLLQLFVKQNPKDQIVNNILHTLLIKQKAGYWQNTATTARVFESIYVLIKERKLESLNFKGSAVISNESSSKLMEKIFRGLGAKPVTKQFSFDSSELKKIKKNQLAQLQLTKDGKGSLYYNVMMRYAIPEELCAARDEGFELNFVIYDEEGNEIKPESADSKVIVLEAGKTYSFETIVLSTQDRNFVATRIPVPSGVEIVDSSLATGASQNLQVSANDNYFSDYSWNFGIYNDGYQYFYDNEAQSFSNYMPAGKRTEKITVRASRRGVYPTPPIQTECMYEPEIFGRTEGYLFIVK